MTFTFAGLLSLSWRLFRRDGGLIAVIAAAFIFLPAYAAWLLCDPLPPPPPAPRDEIVLRAWMVAVAQWGQGNALWFLLADLFGTFGIAAIALLLLDPDRLTVGQAIGQALVRLLAYAIVSIAIAVPVGLGMWLLVLPGLYAQARLIAAIPAMARHPTLRAWMALKLSWRLTRGHDWAITGALVTLFLVQWLAVSPLLQLDETLRAPDGGHVVGVAVVGALIAGAGTLYSVATLLLGAVVYRLRTNSGT